MSRFSIYCYDCKYLLDRLMISTGNIDRHLKHKVEIISPREYFCGCGKKADIEYMLRYWPSEEKCADCAIAEDERDTGAWPDDALGQKW